MLTTPALLSAVLWIFGLSGVLATLSYASWFRSLRQSDWATMVALPRLLSPFCLSLVLFCSGMALSAITNPSPSWWQFAAWTVLAVVFVVLTAGAVQAGRHNGWDTPIEEVRQP